MRAKQWPHHRSKQIQHQHPLPLLELCENSLCAPVWVSKNLMVSLCCCLSLSELHGDARVLTNRIIRTLDNLSRTHRLYCHRHADVLATKALLQTATAAAGSSR